MRVNLLIFILFTGFCGLGLTANAQKPFYKDQQQVDSAATSELNTLMKDLKVIKDIIKKDIQGSYTYKITVNDKSQIASMQFLEKSDDGSIAGQNHFNYLVRTMKFNFKIPKGKYYTFQYTFNTH